jgi:hypothetical protein
MNEIALRHLRQAVKAYLKKDGASTIGAYRDCVTDILHLAYKETNPKDLDTFQSMISSSGFEVFYEELETAEVDKVNKIPDKKLPLHSVNEFEFDVAKTQFIERLKTGSKYYGKKVPTLHNLRARHRP